jgi:hypothetical protein
MTGVIFYLVLLCASRVLILGKHLTWAHYRFLGRQYFRYRHVTCKLAYRQLPRSVLIDFSFLRLKFHLSSLRMYLTHSGTHDTYMIIDPIASYMLSSQDVSSWIRGIKYAKIRGVWSLSTPSPLSMLRIHPNSHIIRYQTIGGTILSYNIF